MYLLYTFICVIFLLFINIKNKKYTSKSLCKFNIFKVRNSKVCKIPCYLTTNYTFPKNRKWYCGTNQLYKLSGNIISFNEDIKFV